MTKKFTIALDLEGTIISSEKTRIPRPGLYDFLEACRQLGRVVIYTMVDDETSREITEELVEKGFAPSWFADVEWIDWFSYETDYKDLNLIPESDADHAVLVDDHRDFVKPGQESHWIQIRFFDPESPDNEFTRVLRTLKAHAHALKTGKKYN